MNIKVKKFFAVFLLVVFITTSYSFCTQPIAAADSFERSISDFPASYKPQLRRLHSPQAARQAAKAAAAAC